MQSYPLRYKINNRYVASMVTATYMQWVSTQGHLKENMHAGVVERV